MGTNQYQNKETSGYVQSVERAIEILEILSASDSPLGITEISDGIGLPKSTVARLLSTLLYKGLVQQEAITKKYRMGSKLFKLGWKYINDLEVKDVVKPFLEELVKEVNETGHFVIEDQGELIYIDKVESNQSLRQYSQIGRSAPWHCTAVGKVILAYKNKEEIEQIIKKSGLTKYTENTITSYEKLIKELEEIRSKGYAVDNEEIQELLRCVAVPIYNYNAEVIGAISISGPTFRIANVEDLADKVKRTAQKISEQLGYTG